MWASLQKLMRLPRETEVYCGHEYTLNNAEFALTVESGNDALQMRAAQVRRQREAGQPTLPTTLGCELDANPFLRPIRPKSGRLWDGRVIQRRGLGRTAPAQRPALNAGIMWISALPRASSC